MGSPSESCQASIHRTTLARYLFLTTKRPFPERSVPEMTEQSGSSHFQELFESALQAYEKKTGITLSRHPLAMKLQSCDSVEGITTLLQGQAKSFKKSDKIIRSMETIVSILTPLSFAASLPDTVGLVRHKALMSCFTSLTIFSDIPTRKSDPGLYRRPT